MFLIQNLAASANSDDSGCGNEQEIFRQCYKFRKAHFHNAVKIPVADIV